MLTYSQILGIISIMDIHFSIGELFAGFTLLGGVVVAYIKLYSSVTEIKTDLVWIKKALNIPQKETKEAAE